MSDFSLNVGNMENNGTIYMGTGALTINSISHMGTFNFTTGRQIPNYPYYTLQLGNGTFTVVGSLNCYLYVSGTLTMGNYDLTSNLLYNYGTITMNNGALSLNNPQEMGTFTFYSSRQIPSYTYRTLNLMAANFTVNNNLAATSLLHNESTLNMGNYNLTVGTPGFGSLDNLSTISMGTGNLSIYNSTNMGTFRFTASRQIPNYTYSYLELTGGTLTLAAPLVVNNTLTFNGGSISATADNINITAKAISMAGADSIATATSGNITLNSTATPGAFDLRAITSAGTISIGLTTKPTTVKLNNAISASGAIQIKANNKIDIDAGITTSSGGVALGCLIELGANITTAASTITFNGPVILTANVTLDTTNGGSSPLGATIQFTNQLASETSGSACNLTLYAGTTGDVKFDGAVGSASGKYNDALSWWSFDETGASEFTAHDSVNSNNGTLTNYGATAGWTTGKVGGALSFDGSNDYVDLNSPVYVPSASGTTISAWIKIRTDATTNRNFIVAIGDGQAPNKYQLDFEWSPSFVYPNHYELSTSYYDVNGTARMYLIAIQDGLNNNAWHHVAFVDNASSPVLYVDGSQVSATLLYYNARPSPTNADDMYIGSRADGSDYFKGSIDEVAVWNRALNSTEVQQLYTGAPLGAITINSAQNVTFSSTVNAASITQSAGTGTTTVNGAVNTSGAISIKNNAINIGNNITTADANITFDGPVVLTAPTVTISTGVSAAGDIWFKNALYSATTASDLILTAGTGNIVFTGAVGGSSNLYDGGNINTVGCWKLDDATGSSTAADSSGKGHTGTLNNMDPATDWVMGLVNGALDFDGINDCVEVTGFSWPQTQGSVTFWMKATNWGTHQADVVLASTHDVINTNQLRFERGWQAAPPGSNDKIAVYFGDATGVDALESTTYLNDSTWYNIAFTWDNSNNVSLYINSALEANKTTTMPPRVNTGEVVIGQGLYADIRTYNGIVDEVAIWDRALSAGEIQILYNYAGNANAPLGAILINSAKDVTFSSAVNAASITSNAGVTPGATAFNNNVTLTGALTVTNNAVNVAKTMDIAGAAQINGALNMNSSSSWTLKNTLGVSGNLTLTSATLSAGANNITIGGNWANNGGTFEAGSSTVEFVDDADHASTISGSTIFNNLTCSIAGKTLYFSATPGDKQTIASLNITGQAGANNLINIYSTVEGTQAEIAVASSNVSYARVRDSKNSHATHIITPTMSMETT